jgi:hypothetical protein
LANPLLASESAVNRLNGTLLEEFVAVSYQNSKLIFMYNIVLVVSQKSIF